MARAAGISAVGSALSRRYGGCPARAHVVKGEASVKPAPEKPSRRAAARMSPLFTMRAATAHAPGILLQRASFGYAFYRIIGGRPANGIAFDAECHRVSAERGLEVHVYMRPESM